MRKLATAAAVSLALASGGAFGLGLGDIEMRSALNQPMNAEIRLTSVKAGELDGMIVQLASADAFARAGIERSSALTDLKFTVDQSSGVAVIRIESDRPVVEPFLNFLLEVDWPQGRMVREYTVLLDPPVFMTPTATERNTSSDQPALVQRGEEALVVPTPIERTAELDGEGSFEVDLVGLEEEVGDDVTAAASAESLAIAAEGEVVTLEPLQDEGLLSQGEPVTLGDGDVVSLTDLNAPNTAAIEQREAEAREAFDINSIEVELVGSLEEVGDDIVFDAQPAVEVDDSTIVSLDELTEPEASTSASTQSGSGSDVNVSAGDTLYEIAQDNAVAGVSVQQMMMALLSANESAFINSNINLVKAGAILRVPDADEAAQLTQTQALAAIDQQNQLWQEYRDNLRESTATQLAGQDSQVETPAQSEESASTDAQAPSAPDSEAIESASLESPESVDGLSEEARAILENARSEILDREELRIVAGDAPSSTTSSATADETTDTNAQRLGEVNRKLQLAREELSASQLQSDDLSDQASELKNTNENLDALVTLRQNEVAALEAQLTTAREASEAAASEAASDATDAAASVAEGVSEGVSDATEGAGELADSAADAVADAAGTVKDGAADVADNAAEAVSDAVDGAATAAGEAGDTVADAGENALTEAGEALDQVELIGDTDADSSTDSEAVAVVPEQQTSWYQEFLNDPKRMMIAGIGGIGLLGVLGTLMFRRKRREDDSILDVEDEVEFLDEEEAASLQKDIDANKPVAQPDLSATGAFAAGTLDNTAHDESLSNTYDEVADSSLAFGSETQAVADATGDDGIDKDDTISEVDVYLAYGLHGQAEELLTKAIERKPDNPEYVQKLLQTFHAQGNGEGFHQAAEDFHTRFGGESNPAWPEIAAMGQELRPNDALYASAHGAVSAVGSGHSDGLALGEDDFLPAQDVDDMGSVSRDFGAGDDAVDMESDEESALLDQSIDPGFAFDEADLEATGDFSAMSDELAAENQDSIDFPGFEEASSAAESITEEPLITSGLAEDAQEMLDEATPVEDLDGIIGSSDDLTLDLDQLSGDLDLDSSELMNSDLSDLELPDLTADNELMIDESSLDGTESADEMDTMLDLAKAYIDMGDKDSASSALGEIVKSGNPEQVTEAETLLRNIS